MPTTFGELIRQTMFKLQPRNDGVTLIAVEAAINDAQKVIAQVAEFDELMTLDTTSATTVADKKSYHVDSDWNLVRCKDIYSIRLMSEGESRKLVYVPFRKLDELIPYTELTGTGKPSWYTQRGKSYELYSVPDDSYSLYIQHSQWPSVLDEDSDQTEFENIDHVIITLSADMALASLEGGAPDWFTRAKQLLGVMINSQGKPDQTRVAQPFSSIHSSCPGEYWNNPFCKKGLGEW